MNGSGDKGVLATHQGNAYRPGMATGTANAAGTFQKPAPVMQAPGATTAGLSLIHISEPTRPY